MGAILPFPQPSPKHRHSNSLGPCSCYSLPCSPKPASRRVDQVGGGKGGVRLEAAGRSVSKVGEERVWICRGHWVTAWGYPVAQVLQKLIFNYGIKGSLASVSGVVGVGDRGLSHCGLVASPDPLVTCRCWCSVTALCPALCNPLKCSTPGFPVLHRLPGFAQTHVRWVDGAIRPSHPLLLPSPPAPVIYTCSQSHQKKEKPTQAFINWLGRYLNRDKASLFSFWGQICRSEIHQLCFKGFGRRAAWSLDFLKP